MSHIIEGRKVTKEDIGSPVTYIPTHARGDVNHSDSERGHISSFSDTHLFVRYNSPNGASTRPRDLVWG